jgi:hypothetical protein
MNIQGVPVDFGFAVTDGAFRVLMPTRSLLRLVPLPQLPPFDVTLRLGAFDTRGQSVQEVLAQNAEGDESAIEFRQDGDDVTFSHDGKSFCYDVVL